MTHLRSRRGRYLLSNRRPGLGTALTAVAVTAALVVTQSAAQGQTPTDDGASPPDAPANLDLSAATDGTAPTAAQLDAVAALGATASWSSSGTPRSLIRYGDALATGIRASSPTAAARAFLNDHRDLYRLESVHGLQEYAEIPLTEDAYVVVMRQFIGGLPVSPGGITSVGVTGSPESGWDIVYVSSTMVPSGDPVASATAAGGISMEEALVAAAADVGHEIHLADSTTAGIQASPSEWTTFQAEGIEDAQLVRRVAFPAADGIRPAYETHYFDGDQVAYRHIIDAATGDVLLRENVVHEADPEAVWDVFPARPPMTGMSKPPWNYPSADTRQQWCWSDAPRCRMVVGNDAAGLAWDIDPATGESTGTTRGNAVDAAEWWLNVPGQRPSSPDRRYQFPWTNVWYETGCHSDNFTTGGNDIDASVTNLFVAAWRMHDWSYRLGFTEETWNAQQDNFGRGTADGDPVIARAQAGAVSPGSRNNATMATRPDGVSSIMSMFLWQPQAAAFYGPCAVGDYDMTVIGHEYTHMIENRLIGKGGNRSGFHAGAMGESWSDFIATEYLNEYRLLTGPADPWTVGAYVTGHPVRGIRNYNMSFPSAGEFPQPGRDVHVGTLNFGSMGYDITGPQVHADSQIWSAVNHDLRSLYLERYPSQGTAHQRQCADGLLPVDECPGNRRWIQTVFDAMLLMPTAPTMLDARDAYFAADLLRFGGANQDLLWLGFARRGFGEHASVAGPQNTDPVPSFESPLHEEATLRFEGVAKDEGGTPVEFEVYVGNYEARATPIDKVERFVPDPDGYNFVARADGYGHVRFLVKNLKPGEDRTITIHFPTNVASVSQGATASGDGQRHADLIDDTEATNWGSAASLPNVVVVDPPSPAAGTYGASGADFGPDPGDGFSGQIVLVDDGSAEPTLGCEPLVGFPAGAIALVDRGECPFTQKVANAQAAGAVAVIVANNVPGDPITMGGADPTIEIPSVMVSLDNGDAIKAGLPATGTVAAVQSKPVEGTQVTISLGGLRQINRAQASAMLLPNQNRFTALRQFELYACTAGADPANPTCAAGIEAGWKRILRSSADAFPAPNPRPSSPDLVLRAFELPRTTATHVKFVVLTNQCTGNPDYHGEQHSDPLAPSPDCRNTPIAEQVNAAELQLLSSKPRVDGATRVG
ncbi:MAG TPA: M36 family metallopeptidase [Natronosporangium sp.]|nr:M36 family metallopeptidase [Natronosporangium sp.]